MLYIRSELLAKAGDKKAGSDKPADVSGGRGEQRGGQYVARVQDGYEHDGSPKYRYFRTEEAYEAYLQGKGKSKQAKELEHKVKQEHEESTDKHSGMTAHHPASATRKPGLLEKEKPISKSLRLYVRI